MGGVLTDLVRWVIEVVQSLEYVGVFVLILAGSLYMPVPTELTLPLFGFLIGHGRLSFVPVVLSATAARVCASLILYAVGLRIGEARDEQRLAVGRPRRGAAAAGHKLGLRGRLEPRDRIFRRLRARRFGGCDPDRSDAFAHGVEGDARIIRRP